LSLRELIIALLSFGQTEIRITLQILVVLDLVGINDSLVVFDCVLVVFQVVVGARQIEVAFWLFGVYLN